MINRSVERFKLYRCRPTCTRTRYRICCTVQLERKNLSKRFSDIAVVIVDVARHMGYDTVKTEQKQAVSEFRDVFVALLAGLPLVFVQLLFELKCTVSLQLY